MNLKDLLERIREELRYRKFIRQELRKKRLEEALRKSRAEGAAAHAGEGRESAAAEHKAVPNDPPLEERGSEALRMIEEGLGRPIANHRRFTMYDQKHLKAVGISSIVEVKAACY